MKSTLHGPLIAAVCLSCLNPVGGFAAGKGAPPPRPHPVLDVAAIDRGRILAAATAALALQPITITAFHAELSEGGPNDFYSNGDYWWPDPANPNGPYIQRDGMSNPDNFTDHRRYLMRLSVQVPALVAAWKITKDARYAEQAARHLRAWFIDERTRMNPHLLYAQAIKGKVTGRVVLKIAEEA